MRTAQQREDAKELKQQQREAFEAVIAEQVLHQLGEPGDLLRVQVRRLWADHYRVNVYVGASLAAATVAHSYFLVTGRDGTIGVASPKITRYY
jgi:hypothetical protein